MSDTKNTISEGYSVGVTTDFRFVTVNVPADDTHPAFRLLFTPAQAVAFAELLDQSAELCVK